MATRPEFNLIYNFRNPPRWREPWVARYRRFLDQLTWIDRDLPTISGIRLTEHHFYDDGYIPSFFVMAGGVATITDRLTLGTNLIQFPLHHPVRVAEDCLVLDIMSGGRFCLGVGLGYAPEEYAGLDVTLASRRKRMVDGLAVVRQAFAGTPVSCDNEFFRIPPTNVTPPPIRPGGPPIWMGASAPVAIERAALLADGFLALSKDAAADYLAACERLGRPLGQRRFGRTYFTLISEDPDRTLDEVGQHMLHRVNDYIVRGAFPGVDVPLSDPRKAVQDGYCLLLDGPGAIREFDDAIAQGASDITITPVMPGEDLDGAAQRIEFLARHVIPHLRPLPEQPS
jgi:alkanesulfonate monooxygenase SsuD/methylene tetrahydromethanopterin reductase-like flavin-dependent oxidoreductase (luciferase family)